jgi:hypothetical protein
MECRLEFNKKMGRAVWGADRGVSALRKFGVQLRNMWAEDALMSLSGLGV